MLSPETFAEAATAATAAAVFLPCSSGRRQATPLLPAACSAVHDPVNLAKRPGKRHPEEVPPSYIGETKPPAQLGRRPASIRKEAALRLEGRFRFSTHRRGLEVLAAQILDLGHLLHGLQGILADHALQYGLGTHLLGLGALLPAVRNGIDAEDVETRKALDGLRNLPLLGRSDRTDQTRLETRTGDVVGTVRGIGEVGGLAAISSSVEPFNCPLM